MVNKTKITVKTQLNPMLTILKLLLMMFKLMRRNNIMGRVRKREMIIVNRIVNCIRFFNSLVMRETKSSITGKKVLYSHFLVLIDLRWRFNNLFEEMFKKRINMTYNEILLLYIKN